MRRSIVLSAIATIATLTALAGVAAATFHQSSRVALTTHRAGHASGFTARISSTDATAPGAKPKRATRLVIAFPANTHFNLGTSLARACTLSDKQLTKPFGPSCPRRSEIGTGSAMINALPMATVQNVRATVNAYVRGADSLLIVLTGDQKLLPGTPPIIIHATVSGSRLTLRLPHVVYGRGKGKFKSFHGVTAVIASLTLSVPAMGSGTDSLLTAGACTRGRFVVSSRFTYADHSTMRLRSSSRCS
jgi:hypothetical protein